MQSPNLKSILNCSIHERSPSLQVLWQHYQSEVNPEGAYSNDPYRREAIVLHALWQLGQFEINPEGASFTEPFRRNAFSCMFCGNMISTKSNLKSILKCSIQERITSLQELWQHYPTELQPEGAYSNDPYWRETILCKFCGSMATLKCELMDHNLLSHEENSFLTNKLW